MKALRYIFLTLTLMLVVGPLWAATYSPVPATYSPSVWPYVRPIIGNGSTPAGGIPPAFAREPRTIASNFDLAPWLEFPSYPKDLNPAGDEAKFRTHCNYSHHAAEDPIVYPRQTGRSHMHTFLGNTLTNKDSTYGSLRRTGSSTCGGGPINRSAYWYPSVLKDNAIGDGKTMIVKPDYAVVYYNVDARYTSRVIRIPRGLNYVFGFNPHDPEDQRTNREIDAANQNGIHSSYRYLTNGFAGWKCESDSGIIATSPNPNSHLQPWLANADGTPTLDCPSNERIGAVLVAPTCWDGVNFTSPNGRDHVRQPIREANTGAQDICPSGWYYIAQFEIIIWFSHEGAEDYSQWYLSSDRMPGMQQFLNGQTMHADWWGAWDYAIMKTWMVNCNGTKIGSTRGKPHSCIDTQFGDGTKGKTGGHLDLQRRWVESGPGRFDPMP